jgi:UDP-N-acetylglucosamine--N-acetylmuramyl-(pentapeptide) pyrophosphoryl-undecaprenol N-acetylglucosamine transferase
VTRVVLAGGGTAGHVNPLLAVAEDLQLTHGLSSDDIAVVGTKEGLESRLIPEAGLALFALARLPFPRRVTLGALAFGPRLIFATVRAVRLLRRHRAQVVAGFGGYVCAPVYLAAWLTKTPLVIHEANAVPGFANRLGARFTSEILTAFPTPSLPGSVTLGMPMARRMSHPGETVSPSEARAHFGLDPHTKTLVVTGGSQGAKSINDTVVALVPALVRSGWQVLHVVGGKNAVPADMPSGYVGLAYCNRMDLALASATAVISRAGAATVAEIQLLEVPALFVPYPVGNGEQEKNAQESVRKGAAIVIADHDFTPDAALHVVVPLLDDQQALDRMKTQAQGLGHRDAAAAMAQVVLDSARKASL